MESKTGQNNPENRRSLGLRTVSYAWMLIAFVLCVGIGKGLHTWKADKKHRGKSKVQKVIPEKPFTVIIPSYNNSDYCEHNLRSVLSQHYENFRVIYIDDCSTDDTYRKVEGIIAQSKRSARVTLVRNPKNQGSLANLYYAIQGCKEDEIIVTVDGDDFLAHEEVLAKLNRVYADPNVWMTYGNFLDYPTYRQKPVSCKQLPKRVIKNNAFRTHAWITSHLRTFYAGLFKRIRLEDLLYEGEFLPMAGDLAFMMPLLEMSGDHTVFIRDILYLYNRSNPLNHHKTNFALQEKCAHYVRNLPPYPRLEQFRN